MKTSNKALLTVLAAIGMGLSASAAAHDRHGHGSKHWHKHHQERHYDRHGRNYDGRMHSQHYYEPRYVVRERVVIHRPVYGPPPAYYYYAPARHPGVVVHVDTPPLMFPLR
jgi:hypothetical protein